MHNEHETVASFKLSQWRTVSFSMLKNKTFPKNSATVSVLLSVN